MAGKIDRNMRNKVPHCSGCSGEEQGEHTSIRRVPLFPHLASKGSMLGVHFPESRISMKRRASPNSVRKGYDGVMIRHTQRRTI